ncbi:hypothetical protein SORBI_3009G099150 [Sorghum bicolor]|uniref:Uncharacterized protein n=1 Tax=Sorghum bicolor TaxID=4558 RepID=A0A1Z5R318_SORBI|nr:hypothetical protein SORBI_3009G099150 [Sorghum bicolor]
MHFLNMHAMESGMNNKLVCSDCKLSSAAQGGHRNVSSGCKLPLVLQGDHRNSWNKLTCLVNKYS